MKTLYFDTNHIDLVGGGGLALYNLSVALQELFDVSLSEPWNSEMAKYEFLNLPIRPFRIGKPDKIDVYLASKYAEQVVPTGGVNIFYCLYPRHAWNMDRYQKILTLSEYSRRAIREVWKRDSEILIGGSFYPTYRMKEPKENMFLSCSRFFMEGDPESLSGHSKNQHIQIAAFRTLAKDLPWTLTLAGSVLGEGDQKYLDVCRKLAAGDPRIKFEPMVTADELRVLYGRAKVFLHAMGYGRKDPAEVEHYGICVEKALISGCRSIVHFSGGAPELTDHIWSDPLELAAEMKHIVENEPAELSVISEENQWRTWDNFMLDVERTFHAYA